jgi:hypothetical protein
MHRLIDCGRIRKENALRILPAVMTILAPYAEELPSVITVWGVGSIDWDEEWLFSHDANCYINTDKNTQTKIGEKMIEMGLGGQWWIDVEVNYSDLDYLMGFKDIICAESE